ELSHHALRQFLDPAGVLNRGLCQKSFGLRAIEARMHAGNIVECLRDSYPARQHGDIGDEADIPHELTALSPGIASEHPQFPIVRSEAQDCIERSGLACAVGTDESENAALFDAQINTVKCDGCAESFAQFAGFYTGHGLALLRLGSF